MRWLSAVLLSNYDRTKLVNRIKYQGNQMNYSSEGFLINLSDVFLEISKVFLDKNNIKV